MRHPYLSLAAALLAAGGWLAGCGTGDQQAASEKTGGAATEKAGALAPLTLAAPGAVQPVPMPNVPIPGYKFPEDSSTINKWVSSADSMAISRHGWGVWAALSSPTQEKLNGDAMFDELAKPVRALMEEAGKRVEDTQTINLHSARGVEMILAPASGPDADTLRQYVVFADTPTGRINISCDISREATAAARPVFKLLAQTVQVVR